MGQADLHLHTDFSDGLHCPRQVVQAAARKGLPLIAVTDHDTIEGALRARSYAEARPDLGVEVILGEEVSTVNGHVIGLFLQEFVPPRLTALRTVELIHRQGGLAILAHPFHLYAGKAKGFPRAVELLDRIPFDGIETVNQADALSPLMDARAKGLPAQWDLARIGSSDAHDSRFIGMGLTLFEGEGAEDLRRAILGRKTEGFCAKSWGPGDILRHLGNSGRVLNRYSKLTTA